MLEYGRIRDRALLICEPGLEFIRAFMAYLYAGITAIPINLPNPTQKDTVTRFMAIAGNARPSLVLTHTAIRERLFADYGKTGPLTDAHWIVTDQCDTVPLLAIDKLATLRDNELALLQYTSGSTRAPKGVMVLHKNLMHNSRLIRKAFRHDEISFFGVIWLPHYHDMGLMGGIFYTGAAAVLMSPGAFIHHPLL